MLASKRKLSAMTRFLGNIENGTVVIMGKQPCRAVNVDKENDTFALKAISWSEVE